MFIVNMLRFSPIAGRRSSEENYQDGARASSFSNDPANLRTFCIVLEISKNKFSIPNRFIRFINLK